MIKKCYCALLSPIIGSGFGRNLELDPKVQVRQGWVQFKLQPGSRALDPRVCQKFIR